MSRGSENGFVTACGMFVVTSDKSGSRVLRGVAVRQSRCVSKVDPSGPERASKMKNRRAYRAGRGAANRQLGRKSEGQQARAEQHEAGCGQGQETVGDKVMMAHVTS